jgi:protein-disulfide isomerase
MASTLRNTFATAILALVFGFVGAGLWSFTGAGDNRTREYLLENPEILPEMAEAYQAKQASERLAQLGDGLYRPFPGAFLGNPKGTRVLVEFTDYNCTYCRASLADVNRLIKEDPQLKVVMREFPIFEGSAEPARMALAAAMQGKYDAFHNAMFDQGATSPADIEAAARTAGLDLERAKRDAQSEKITVELASNTTLAQSLGFDGTPGWVTGNRVVMGYVGFDALKQAITDGAKGSASGGN